MVSGNHAAEKETGKVKNWWQEYMTDKKIIPMSDEIEIPPRRPLTLRDVSEASGVSEMTVSRVLRNRGDVSDATREKVLKAAKTLGYVPNKIAGADITHGLRKPRAIKNIDAVLLECIKLLSKAHQTCRWTVG